MNWTVVFAIVLPGMMLLWLINWFSGRFVAEQMLVDSWEEEERERLRRLDAAIAKNHAIGRHGRANLLEAYRRRQWSPDDESDRAGVRRTEKYWAFAQRVRNLLAKAEERHPKLAQPLVQKYLRDSVTSCPERA